MEYIAHIRESDDAKQFVVDHLLEVKKLCEDYGREIGISHVAGLAGVLHDAGKYSSLFQEYLKQAVQNPENPPRRGEVDHSTAGGKLLYNLFYSSPDARYKLLVEIVGNAIISHHSNLHDYLSPERKTPFLNRVRDKDIPEFDAIQKHFFAEVMSISELEIYMEKAADELLEIIQSDMDTTLENQLHFITKLVFSCLIDADRTNTRQFEENELHKHPSSNFVLFQEYYENLMNHIESFGSPTTIINSLRSEMSKQTDDFAIRNTGVYSLSIPTGGGKTLASFRFALQHSLKHNKEKIIFVVPFTTIIEQNAQEIRNIIRDDEHLLEHHSNVVEEDEDDENFDGILSVKQKLKLAKDNWDAPVIFTTMVQFLNTFYAKGNRNTRRLHNLSNAVIIFDEVQKVPIKTVSLFNTALNFLHKGMNTTSVLCTATQPSLEFVEKNLKLSERPEMIHDLKNVAIAFKRTEIIDEATQSTMTTADLTEFVELKKEQYNQVLVILNTKSTVRNLFSSLKTYGDSEGLYHLSTSMCAAHRKQILEEVRRRLKDGKPVVCISTQLIEAGVDISFGCVIRSLAGLDSIAQAAGRCNRHGEDEIRPVFIIDHSEELLDKLKEIQIGKQITKRMLIDMQRDPLLYDGELLSTQAMKKYFAEYFSTLSTELDYFIPEVRKNMMDLLSIPFGDNELVSSHQAHTQKSYPLCQATSYRTAADHFDVIEDASATALVPFEGGEELIGKLMGNPSLKEISILMKKIQQYTIGLYPYEVNLLIENNGIRLIESLNLYVLIEGTYSAEYGVSIEKDEELKGLFM